jgi:hypothetical protein
MANSVVEMELLLEGESTKQKRISCQLKTFQVIIQDSVNVMYGKPKV